MPFLTICYTFQRQTKDISADYMKTSMTKILDELKAELMLCGQLLMNAIKAWLKLAGPMKRKQAN